MSDRYGCNMTIGGRATSAVLRKLSDLILRNKPDLCLIEEGRLLLEDSKACDGLYPEVEEFCMRNRLQYIRHSEGHGSIKPEVMWWLSDTNRGYTLAEYDGAWFDSESIRSLDEIIDELSRDKTRSGRDAWAQEGIELLRRLSWFPRGLEVDPLTVVDQEGSEIPDVDLSEILNFQD